jgi:transposase
MASRASRMSSPIAETRAFGGEGARASGVSGCGSRRTRCTSEALVDAKGLPIALKLTEGQRTMGRSARDARRPCRGQILLADRAYDSDELRKTSANGRVSKIKPMPNRKNIPAFSRYFYRYGNFVERFFNFAVAARISLHQTLFGYECPETESTDADANNFLNPILSWSPSEGAFLGSATIAANT